MTSVKVHADRLLELGPLPGKAGMLSKHLQRVLQVGIISFGLLDAELRSAMQIDPDQVFLGLNGKL